MCQDCIQYPVEWLDKEAYGFFSTNRDVLHDPEEREFAVNHTPWFNPFEEPEKLAEQRRSFDGDSLKWKRFVEEHYPGIDSKEQRRLAIEENNAERLGRCGEVHYRKNKYNPKKTDKQIWYCKVKDCPICDARKARGIIKRLTDNRDEIVLYEVNAKEAARIKKDRTKNDYEQYNCEETGKVYLILDVADSVEGLEAQRLTTRKIKEISEATVACEKKRQSGKLLVKPTEKEEKNNEPEVELKRRIYTVDFSESDLETHDELDELVSEEFEPVGETMDLDVLQYTTYVLEQLTIKVAERHCAKIHFRGVETVKLRLSKVDWWEFIKDPFEV